MIGYNVTRVAKNEVTEIPLGFFCTESYADVSAVIYSALATWGKIRALANNPDGRTIFTTLHPNPDGLPARVKKTLKHDYVEHLLDGLYVLHNPFAVRPIDRGIFSHSRLAECRVAHDGVLLFDAPADFLLTRSLFTISTKANN
jgi:hypothetical protein